ncbi:MAG TPA: hypothetical protein VMT36_05010, partial [Candidatus Saccharimonadia bacterium]|nr:hypothetical protein [Candidatus Saccharimonadia bacterium]
MAVGAALRVDVLPLHADASNAADAIATAIARFDIRRSLRLCYFGTRPASDSRRHLADLIEALDLRRADRRPLLRPDADLGTSNESKAYSSQSP